MNRTISFNATSWRIAALIGLAFATACDSWLTKPSFYSSVPVTATRRNGAPIPGVSLILYTGPRPMAYASTGPDGRYTFTSVPRGIYGVYASPPDGYATLDRLFGGNSTGVADELTVAHDTVSAVHFTFLRVGPGIVIVRVANPDGSALDSIPVTLYGPTADSRHALTDSAGFATFTAVPFGAYGVIITRPFLYRDYRTFNDSIYSSRDNLIVEEGSRDSVVFSIKKCSGSVRVTARDQAGTAVPAVTTAFFSSTRTLGVAVTGADGRVTFTDAPCATPLGVAINPPAGYTAVPGRGTSFVDGISVTDGATVDVVFRVQKGS